MTAIAIIGAMDEEGMFVVPVNYGFEWEDELLLYFHSAKEGRKADAFLTLRDAACDIAHDLGLTMLVLAGIAV